jgi:hypothetical protein
MLNVMSTKLLTPAGVSSMACRLLQQNTGTPQGRVHRTTSTQYVTTVQATAHHTDCLGCLVPAEAAMLNQAVTRYTEHACCRAQSAQGKHLAYSLFVNIDRQIM